VAETNLIHPGQLHLLPVVCLTASHCAPRVFLNFSPIGLALSLGLNRVVSGWVGITTNHPLIVLAVSLLLLAVAGLACLLPASKALSIDPMAALRSE